MSTEISPEQLRRLDFIIDRAYTLLTVGPNELETPSSSQILHDDDPIRTRPLKRKQKTRPKSRDILGGGKRHRAQLVIREQPEIGRAHV